MNLFKGIFFIIVISIFALYPFFHPGFFTFHDDTQVARVYEMGKSLHDGMIPVRWVKDLGYGYGYPLFNFYSPFPYYLAGVLMLVGINALLATKIIFVMGILIAAFSMFFLAKRLFNTNAGIVAAVIYLYFPYHAVNIFVRGDLDELFAYAFLPLVFLGMFSFKKIAEHSQKFSISSMLLTGLSIALVILSHNLTFYMLSLFIILFVIFSVINVRYKKIYIISIATSLLLAFLLSAFYAIPAILEMKYTNVFSQVGGGAYYPDHFVCIPQLWDSIWGFGGSTKGCLDGLSFKLGKSNIVFVLLALVLCIYSFLRKKKYKNTYLSSLSIGFLLFSLFMTTALSEFIWKVLPMSSFLQYPWRFLNFAGVFMAIMTGSLIYYVSNIWGKKVELAILVAVILVTLLYNAKLFVPQTYVSWNSDNYTNQKYLTVDVSKISDEYLPPKFNKKKPVTFPLSVQSGVGSIELLTDKTGYIKAIAHMQKNGEVVINIAPFPAWEIFIDRKKIPSDFDNITLRSGDHLVELQYVETTIEKISNLLTVIGVIVLIFGIITLRRETYEHKKTS